MGNLNCKECLGKDLSFSNEMLINQNLSQNESDQEYIRNTRSNRLKILKTAQQENQIIDLEDPILISEPNIKTPLKKVKKVNPNILRKEERDNNILLKSELNKIKDININKSTKINNSDEMTKLIESQRQQILAQEKIIEEYKNKEMLFLEQQKQMEQTKKIIKEQQMLINNNIKEIEKKQTQKISRNQLKKKIPIIKTSNTEMNLKNKKKLTQSKSSPKLKTNNFKNNDLNKFERTQVIQPNFINIIKEKNKRRETIETNEENQIEENDNYEKVEDFDEEEEKLNNNFPPQSQRFKIETYEPLEASNRVGNEDIMNSYNEINDLTSEPRDSIKEPINEFDSMSNYNEKKNKNENGPKDSGIQPININFRGTFENKEQRLG